MPLTDLALHNTYDPDRCPDLVGEFYSPALAESVAYDRDTFTFTAKGLVAAAAGLVGLLRNDGRVRIVSANPQDCQRRHDRPSLTATSKHCWTPCRRRT